jgi:hypothetical protein
VFVPDRWRFHPPRTKSSPRMPLPAPRLALALATCAALPALSCQKPREPPPPSAATAPAALAKAEPTPPPALRPPEVLFVAPTPWQSRKPNTPPVPPPDIDAEVWRAFVTQNEPLQIKTPRWQSLPPRETVEVAMPAISKFRCVVTPLSVVSDANDFNTKLKAWVMTRQLLCSNDGWHSWTEYSHTARIPTDGEREMQLVPQALLREREPDQSIRQTFVLLRSDKEQLEATTGPPRILPGVKVDDD